MRKNKEMQAEGCRVSAEMTESDCVYGLFRKMLQIIPLNSCIDHFSILSVHYLHAAAWQRSSSPRPESVRQ